MEQGDHRHLGEGEGVVGVVHLQGEEEVHHPLTEVVHWVVEVQLGVQEEQVAQVGQLVPIVVALVEQQELMGVQVAEMAQLKKGGREHKRFDPLHRQ